MKLLVVLFAFVAYATAQAPVVEIEHPEVITYKNGTVCEFCEMGIDMSLEETGILIEHGKAAKSYPWWKIPFNEDDSFMYLWIDKDASVEEQQFKVVSLHYEELIGPVKLHPYFNTPHGTTMHKKFFDRHAGLEVFYNCSKEPSGIYVLTMNLTIEFEGYSPPVSVRWTKECLGNSPPQPDDGWNGAQIFFFTVFILTCVFCVAGCGYNYVQREKQGLDMVPGIDMMRKCKNVLFPERRYTPQMDYNSAPGGSDNEYGATYQTNL